jgi:hypothetical protein
MTEGSDTGGEGATNALCTSCGCALSDEGTSCFHCGQERRRSTLTRGQVIADRYELIRVLGHGGMGTVYEVIDRYLDERLALKVLSGAGIASGEARRRFRAEIKLARRIRHPNVCAIHEYGEIEDLQYIVMELVQGQDLKQYLRSHGPLELAEAVDLARQIGAGLHAIHQAGVIHRDLKPANVMRTDAGQLRLMDFGIAKGFGEERATTSGVVVGTAEYMSPEQAQGGPLDPRSDVYALAIVIYELLTGEVPFRANTLLATIMLHLTEPPALDKALIPATIAPVLRRGLAKKADERYETSEAMVRDLIEAASGKAPLAAIVAHEVPASTRGAASAASYRVGLAALGVAVLAGGAWIGYRSGSQAPIGAGTQTRPSPEAQATPIAPASPAPTGVPSATPGPLVAMPRPDTAFQPSPRPISGVAGAAATGTLAATPSSTPVGASPSPTAAPAISLPTETNDAPVPQTGLLQVGARPFARVSVDDIDAGLLPLKPLELSVGRHVVRFTHPDYQPLQRVITVRPGETSKLFIDFALDGIAK